MDVILPIRYYVRENNPTMMICSKHTFSSLLICFSHHSLLYSKREAAREMDITTLTSDEIVHLLLSSISNEKGSVSIAIDFMYIRVSNNLALLSI